MQIKSHDCSKTGPVLALPPQAAWSPRSETFVGDVVPRTTLGTWVDSASQGPALCRGVRLHWGCGLTSPEFTGFVNCPRGEVGSASSPRGSCCHPGWLLGIPCELPNPHSFTCFKQDISPELPLFLTLMRRGLSTPGLGHIQGRSGTFRDVRGRQEPPGSPRGSGRERTEQAPEGPRGRGRPPGGHRPAPHGPQVALRHRGPHAVTRGPRVGVSTRSATLAM